MDKVPSVEMMGAPLMTFTITAGELRRMLEMPRRLVDNCLLKAKADKKRLWLEVSTRDLCHVSMITQQMEQPLFGGTLWFEEEKKFAWPVKEVYSYFKTKSLFPKAKELDFAFDKEGIHVRFEIDGNEFVKKFHQEACGLKYSKALDLAFPVEVPDVVVKEFLRVLKTVYGHKDSADHVKIWCTQKSPRRGTIYLSDVGIGSVSTPNTARLKYPAHLTKGKRSGNVSGWDTPETDGLIMAMYPKEFLEPAIKGLVTVSDAMTGKFATNYPMAIEWSHEGLSGTYLCAPRIESK